MYVGRLVAVAKTTAGANSVLYRVSSRSFPNRQVVRLGDRLAVVPRPGSESDVQKNPYIAYNAVRLAGGWAVAANGSHADPIAEKLESGATVKDAMALTLLTLDYERDDYSTPRVAAAVPASGDNAWLATVRNDALVVKQVSLTSGQAQYLATYDADDVSDDQTGDFDAETADDAARFAIDGGAFASLTHPVATGAALAGESGFELGTHIVESTNG
jgi:IMP cyclohydrolase